MADSFRRLVARTIPQEFASNNSFGLGRPRVYSADASGILVGGATATYGYEISGNPSGSRARSVAEAQWGTPTNGGVPYAVGRLSTGKTLYQLVSARTLIGSQVILQADTSAITLPITGGRYFVACCMTGDGRYIFMTSTTNGMSYGGGVDRWHLLAWTGSGVTLVREGTIGSTGFGEYTFGPGATAQIHFGAAMLESDLLTLWKAYTPGGSVDVWRIDAAGVLQPIYTFQSDGLLTSGFQYPALYADNGLCATVAGTALTVHTSRVVVADTPIKVAVQVPPNMGLLQIDNGVFDLLYYDPSVHDQAVETLVYAVLFTDVEAPVSREPDRYLRRGWWIDPQAGSGLWHVRRQPLGSVGRREAIEMVRDVLEAHGLTSVDVQEVTGTAGSVSGLTLTISGFYSGRQFIVSVPL